MSLDEKFRKAAENVRRLKQKPTEDEMLKFYALFKQAELGDCNIPRPGMFDFAGKAKWDAWNNEKGLSKDEAKEQYVNLIEILIGKYGVE